MYLFQYKRIINNNKKILDIHFYICNLLLCKYCNGFYKLSQLIVPQREEV